MRKSNTAYQYSNRYYYNTDVKTNVRPVQTNPFQEKPIKKTVVQKKNEIGIVSKICAFSILGLLGAFVIPYGVKNVTVPIMNYDLHPEINIDFATIIHPTTDYMYDTLFLNRRISSQNQVQTKMNDLYMTDEMIGLRKDLKNLMLGYKTIEPSIFVWEYDSGKYVDINADKHFSAASIIKIPVLLEVFKSIEAQELSIDETMTLTEYYRSEGSGKMKYHQVGNKYTIDNLARMMIEQSDNTATNMLVAAVGGMPRVNSAIKSWGIKNTEIKNWLPDLEGTNYTTSKDLAKMLYNIENTSFISTNSKNYIFDYMGHVENNRLIKAGLPNNATFIHKTGDIGSTLGDAGIVTTPTGKKYIVSIIANRPYNSPLGKNFIVKASNIIYNYIAGGNY